jgi:copper transport protein
VTALCCVITVVVLGLLAPPAAAHNSLVASNPADGAVLESAPREIVWTFAKSVPLDTLTVTLIDAAGVRTEIAGSVHDIANDAVVITPLPIIEAGPLSVRWRLVSADGHAVTGRVDLTVGVTVTPPDGTLAMPDAPAGIAESADDPAPSSAPAWMRWTLRYVSYAAIMTVIGILLTAVTVWPDARHHPSLRRALSTGLVATGVLALAQLVVLASDIGETSWWASIGSVGSATTTQTGMALALRLVAAMAMWVTVTRAEIRHDDIYWTAITIPSTFLLGTWAFAGHASTMRWPVVGVVTDVMHHAAAAAWLGGLAIVAGLVMPRATPEAAALAVRRFSAVAAASVGVLMATGLVHTVRLVGGPGALLSADHGRYLAAKVAAVLVMVAIAALNRRRVGRYLGEPSRLREHLGPMRRAMLLEVAIGLVVLGITAAMVVSPPAVAL